jgi:hypothetical protein
LLGTAVAGTAAAVTGITLQANAPTGFGEVAGGCQDWTACASRCQDWTACASRCQDWTACASRCQDWTACAGRCQDWIACVGDGAPINSWQRYGLDWSKTPSPSDQALHAWPGVRDYPRTCPTGYAELGNGPPSCPASRQAVNTRFRWMQENGQDPAARQRFNPIGGSGPTGGEGRPASGHRPGAESGETYGRILAGQIGLTPIRRTPRAAAGTRTGARTALPLVAGRDAVGPRATFGEV